MIEAVKTTASPAEIWAIVVVAVVCLAIWLGAVAWAAEHPLWPHHRIPDMPGPVPGGMHLAEGGRSVSPNREAAATLSEPLAEVPEQRSGEADRTVPEHTGSGPGTTDRRGAGN